MDVDIVLAMNDANVDRFVSMAKRLGLKPSIPVPIEALSQPGQLDQWHREKGMIAFSLREFEPAGLVVDVLVRPSVPFKRLHQDAVRKSLGDTAIPVASIAHLIELETGTGRSIDAFDIVQLSALNLKRNP